MFYHPPHAIQLVDPLESPHELPGELARVVEERFGRKPHRLDYHPN